MAQSGQSNVFGKRREPHTIIIAQGDSIRHFTVRPWIAALAGSVLAAFAIGYLLATSYLVLRDDLLGAAMARQARMQHSYEDRISSLRAQVDRITSRQMLDQQLMEDKVGELLKRQTALSQRHGRLGPLLDRASAGKEKKGQSKVPIPTRRPDKAAGLDTGNDIKTRLMAGVDSIITGSLPLFSGSKDQRNLTAADRADRLFTRINASLRDIESEQISHIQALTSDAYYKAEAIAEALRTAGVRLRAANDQSGMGGPLIAPGDTANFESHVRELDQALGQLKSVKSELVRYPIKNPAPGRKISSRFGVRKDPLLGTPAFHSGMDFRAPSGAAVRATATGKVVKAGWTGGYGRMVEIDHGNGLKTRYAHLSKILVKKGQRVGVHKIVGRIGSSGRSTGPHLHYEIRKRGKSVNPLRFLRAGKKVKKHI